jgi:hypothetical protein
MNRLTETQVNKIERQLYRALRNQARLFPVENKKGFTDLIAGVADFVWDVERMSESEQEAALAKQ